MVQKFSQSQIQAKRKWGFYFYYDDNYIAGHKCKATAHVLIILDSDDFPSKEIEAVEGIPEIKEQDVLIETLQISLHAMSRIVMPHTLKFKGSIGELNVSVLMDGGSTHNFFSNLRPFSYCSYHY